MISSMTGYASLESETAGGVLILELRSVNHRYLELQTKLDESLRSFEPLVRAGGEQNRARKSRMSHELYPVFKSGSAGSAG